MLSAAAHPDPAVPGDAAVRGGVPPARRGDPRAAARAPRSRPGWPGRKRGGRLGGWLVLAIPAAVELVLGGYRLGGPSLWRDEAYTIDVVARPIGRIVATLGNVDAVHGPYYLAMHFVAEAAGTSAVALRLPSLLAMAVTAALTAALGRRVAAAAAMPAPAATGLAAGLLFAAVPQTTYYAQDARPYAMVVLFAVAATYLLVRAAGDGRWGWWAGYGAALALAAAGNLFALLIVPAHGVTLLACRARGAPARGSPAGPPRPRLLQWLAAVLAAVLAVSPIIALGYRQSATLGWLHRPGPHAVARLVAAFAGSVPLVPLVAAVAIGGVLAGLLARGPREISPVTVALPWLVLPPVILLAVSQVHPAYVERYVVFCQPALALLAATGLTALAALAGRVRRASTPRAPRVVAWVPAAVVAVAFAAGFAGPQAAVRRQAATPDNLRAAAAIVAAHELPGDAIFYIPAKLRADSMAYPAPYLRLRDVALARSPFASGTLSGVQVGPAELAGRLSGVRRIWLFTQKSGKPSATQLRTTQRAELAVVGRMRLVGRWRVRGVTLLLYAARGTGAAASG